MGLNDPRTYGSKNPGATNVLRSGSKAAAVVTLLLDALKGWLPVVLVRWYGRRRGLDDGTVALVGLAAVLGHLYPVFRYSSLSSLTAAVAAPLVYVLASGTAWYAETPVLLALVAMAALLVYRHRENIQRLLAGTESRLGQKKKT